jgi:ubiquinone/menaquinone biosynthesis C-methylase UbiE
VIDGIWNIYGHVYDGLLKLYPYRYLCSTVVEWADPIPGSRVVDIGCGTGNVTKLLSNSGAKVVAIDNSATMLGRLRKKLRKEIDARKVTVIEGDAVRELENLDDHSVDRVVMMNVLYALGDRHKLWRELGRVTKSEGRIVITNSDRGGSSPIIKEHLQHDSFFSLISPKVIAVGLIDYLISQLASTGQFSFLTLEQIESEAAKFDLTITRSSRIYGGEKDGVNLLLELKPTA